MNRICYHNILLQKCGALKFLFGTQLQHAHIVTVGFNKTSTCSSLQLQLTFLPCPWPWDKFTCHRRRVFQNQYRCISKYPVEHTHLRPKLEAKSYDNKKPSISLALEYFDTFYKPIYGDLWPSIRLGLLSSPKCGALLNNFYSDEHHEVSTDMIVNGADNMLDIVQHMEVCEDVLQRQKQLQKVIMTTTQLEDEQPDISVMDSEQQHAENQDLSYFVPATPVRSTLEELKHTELQEGMSMTDEREVTPCDVPLIHSRDLNIPKHLRIYAAEKGSVIALPENCMNSLNQYAYHSLDAAMLLPVLALDVHPKDRILHVGLPSTDIILTILNTMLTESFVLLPSTYFEKTEFLDDLEGKVLPSHYDKDKLRIFTGKSDMYFDEMQTSEEKIIDKVIINAPGFDDRLSLVEEDFNMFSKRNIDNRLEIPRKLKKLLVNSILGVQKHGGTIVYCAKTLSPSQCDTVVYAAINEVMQNSDVTLSVVDMAYMAEKFSETFKFCSVKPFCHLGQLVLPNTTANFGPLYFCRIDVEGTES